MEIIKTGLRTFREMWIIFLGYAVTVVVIDAFLSNTSMLGVQLVLHTMLVFLAHLTIIRGSRPHFFKNADANVPSFSIKFFGLIALVLWIPLVVGLVVGMLSFDSDAQTRLAVGAGLALALVLAAFTVFGLKLPRHVWVLLFPHNPLPTQPVRTQKMFILLNLIVLNGVGFILVIGLNLAIGFLLLKVFPTNVWAHAAFAMFTDFLGYYLVAQTAAILTHAHLRAYDLPPQGLIHKL